LNLKGLRAGFIISMKIFILIDMENYFAQLDPYGMA
jgi:hypothetical protein